MNRTIRIIFTGLPFLTFIFTLWVVYEIVAGIQELNVQFLIFTFTLFEVYVNWIAIVIANTNMSKCSKQDIHHNITVKIHSDQVAPVKLTSNSKEMLDRQDGCMSHADLRTECSLSSSLNASVKVHKIWFCPKCKLTTPQNCYHCPLCKRCIIMRDHHCFFLGACISKQNLSNFIVLCFYASILSYFATMLIYSQLSVYFQNNSTHLQSWILARYFFPVSLGHWLSGVTTFHILTLVSIFDLCISLSISTFCFGLYYFHLVATGEMQQKLYDSYSTVGSYQYTCRKNYIHNLTFVFENWGVVNFVFPVAVYNRLFSLKEFRLPVLSSDYKVH